jgi:hypothetical protein
MAIALLVTMGALNSAAAVAVEHDTVYFYNTWEEMMCLEPEALFVDPFIDIYTPYEIYVDAGDEDINEMIRESHLAISIGDSIWLVNSDFLKKEFKGDTRSLSDFVPIFFNDKTAYIVYPSSLSVKDVFLNYPGGDMNYAYTVDYYYIDFEKRTLRKVTHNYLSELLEDYHDLQMRYEGMKDYKKFYVIEDYFFKFLERVDQDFMRPYILDLVK